MREITIDDKKYNISCTVYTTFLYKQEFKSKMMDDFGKFIQIQSALGEKNDELAQKKISKDKKNIEISKIFFNGADDTIEILLQITYAEIKTANPNFMNYMDFVKTISSIGLNDQWVLEVVTEASNCFRG